MRSYKDTKARVWSLDVTVAAVKRVKALVGVDLYALADDGLKPLAALMGDVVRLVDVLFVLARDPAGKPPASDEDFAEGLAGDALGEATDAFVDALIDFFPQPRARTALGLVKAKSKALAETLARRAIAELEALDPEAEAQKLRAGKASSGKSPAASGSTPAP